jgi:hypothetical protein
MRIPPQFLTRVAAFLAGEGFTVLTAPASLIAKALKVVARA